jgi:hypothetical protein
LLDIVNGPFLTDQNYQAKLNQDEAFCLKRMGKAYAKMAEFEAAHPQQVRNIQYVDLLKSPVDEIVSVYRELDFAPDVGLPQKIQEFLARQKAGGRARPRQEMTAHGYTREQVESDPVLASYLKRYEVVLEPTRNTGVI